MKKILAVMMALMMLALPAMGSAATQLTATYTLNAETISALVGDSDTVAQMCEVFGKVSCVETVTGNGALVQYNYDGTLLYDYAIELDGTVLYINSSLLDTPLYIDFMELMQQNPEIMALLAIDWNGLLNDVAALNISADNTTAAIMTIAMGAQMKGGNVVITLTADDVCNVIDAIAADIKATEGLEQIAEKYFGFSGLNSLVDGCANVVKATVRSAMEGKIVLSVANDGTYGSLVFVDTYGNATGIALSMNNSGVSIDLVSGTENNLTSAFGIVVTGDTLSFTMNGRTVASITVQTNDNGFTMTINAMGETIVITGTRENDNTFAFTVAYGGMELKLIMTVQANTLTIEYQLNNAQLAVVTITADQIADFDVIPDKTGARNILSLTSEDFEDIMVKLNQRMTDAMMVLVPAQ